MAIQELSYFQAKQLALERLRQWVMTIPPSRRSLKVVWRTFVISPLEMIREVENDTEIGQKIVSAELEAISEIEGITYIVKQG